ncbi:MAG: type II secretion system secretin GspD [Candidatus Competibacteraceae bacterium]|nr:type II secretion system secretin GspD [Candidatus Competibacteraceae bacterium]MCP5125905.1 type II secretion system secretin GspD [Gammaproteobacteria bacterium]HRX69810.1 type II secretion system secretin GspD [Candidatus Competibacteraceae bacterium]
MTHWLNKRLTSQWYALRRQILAALLGGFLALPALAAPVTLNLKDADINALVESMSVLTGKNFIVDPRVKGRVTIISSKPMDEKELYEVFLAVLGVHGFAAVPGDKVIKIVPAAGAKQESVPTVDQTRGIAPDQVVTRVIQVQNVSAAQIVPILRPLIPPQGHLAAYTPTNVLIISDNASNVERIASIISRIDLASNEEVEIVALQHASATDIVRVLTALEQGKARTDPTAGVGAPTRMVADERTNSILLSGDQTSRVRLRTLIAHLDTPVDAGGNTQVIYLRYAKAKDLVTVLQGVSKNLSNEVARNAPIPGQPGGAPGGSVSSSSGSNLVDIQADEATNALVVTAPPDIIRSLRSVIAQLDIRRAQVLVEAVIAEISAEKTAQLGVQWAVDSSEQGLVGFTNFDAGASSLANMVSLAAQIDEGSTSSIQASQVPQGIQLGVGDFTGTNRFGALISALAKDADTNVLSTPTVVTMDNEEAEIIVGQNVPFVTGSYTTTTSSGSSTSTQVGNPFQTIQRDDVGIKLKVKPQINEGNAVKLEISQEVSSVVPSANAATQGPTTNKRSIKTIVMVENNQILVLGGLIDDQLTESAQKVPLLGDVPLLGNLFRYRDTNKLKRNLMVFLHPIILRDPAQGTLYTSDKYSYIREQQLAAREKTDYLLPDVQPPLLKPPEEVKQQGTILNMTPAEMPPSPPPPPPPVEPPAEFGFGNK